VGKREKTVATVTQVHTIKEKKKTINGDHVLKVRSGHIRTNHNNKKNEKEELIILSCIHTHTHTHTPGKEGMAARIPATFLFSSSSS
jgi:hypothetical protein